MDQMNRREMMALSGAVAGAAALAPSDACAKPLDAPDATEIAARIRRKDITALEAVDEAISRAQAAQPQLNFLVTDLFERARAEARAGGQTGPFAGVPFLVKDLNDVKGAPTHHGSRAPEGALPAASQDVYVDAFQRAGLIFIGKSATPEAGFLPTTEPIAFGPTRNPWDLARSSGGSSGGAAAATAAGVVAFAHASDGGGSIRIPSSCCGLFGLKPSRGRMLEAIPGRTAEDIGVSHCVSRSVRDSAALFAATEAGAAGGLFPPVGMVTGASRRRLKIGLLMETLSGAQPNGEVVKATETAAALLKGMGHHVRPAAWPLPGAQFFKDFIVFWALGAQQMTDAATKRAGRAAAEAMFEPFTLGLAGLAAKQAPADVGALIGRLNQVPAAYAHWFTQFDVVLSPVLSTTAPEIGAVGPSVPFDDLIERLTYYVGYTPLENVAGGAAMSVPLAMSPAGLPIGAHFAAKPGDERTLFELAYELEAAQPWKMRQPPHWFGG